MKLFINHVILLLLLVGIFSCRKPYNPPVTTSDYAYLVVEGVINSGSDSTIITLSRTVPIGAPGTHRPETGAKVLIESDGNATYQLSERDSGKYVTANLNLPTTNKYRLHIFTSSGKEYESDFVENKITPTIDTITHSFQPHSVQFYVSSHDPSKKTRYYRWEYHEYWSYTSNYFTVLQYKDSAIIGLPVDSDYFYCYRHATPANGIYFSSSDKLSQDVISQQPINHVEGQSGKLVREYAVEVVQFAITKEAYTYWQQLKTNTEQLGSIFDAQPSSFITNIHCVSNPAESVIGYVSVSTSTLKRDFVSQADVPFAVVPVIGALAVDTPNCHPPNIILFAPLPTLPGRLAQLFGSRKYAPWDFYYDPPTIPIGYKYNEIGCVDCRVLGGTNKKPIWWPWQN
jgi:hypothetical protein